MIKFEDVLGIPAYSMNKKEKSEWLTGRLKELSIKHRDSCEEYSRILKILNAKIEEAECYYDLPFLPVRLFKELELKSIENEHIFKTMTSSGTTGQVVSKIYLDRLTASNQQKVLAKIVSEFTGKNRMPMLIIDSPSVIKNRAMFSARGAGILGFSSFGSDKQYALNDNMEPDFDNVQLFLEKHKGEKILVFGFTFMIWQHFYKELIKKPKCIDLSNAVSPEEFRESLDKVCGLNDIHDYYGMVEQTGCIYMQCEHGHLHASNFSDVIIRDAKDFSVCDNKKKGIIQVVSAIPESYPGHSIITEDEGVILGEDDCPCGRCGKYFKVLGRVKNAEIRGCSDTYERH